MGGDLSSAWVLLSLSCLCSALSNHSEVQGQHSACGCWSGEAGGWRTTSFYSQSCLTFSHWGCIHVLLEYVIKIETDFWIGLRIRWPWRTVQRREVKAGWCVRVWTRGDKVEQVSRTFTWNWFREADGGEVRASGGRDRMQRQSVEELGYSGGCPFGSWKLKWN